MSQMVKWTRLIKTEPRGSILYNIIESHLQPDDTVLDINCGYSPLAKSLIDNNYNITGIDISDKAIKFLNNTHPQGTWINSSIEKFYNNISSLPNFNVLVSLGPIDIEHKAKHQNFFKELLEQMAPRLVFFEVAMGPCSPPKDSWYIDPKPSKSSPHEKAWIKGFNRLVQTTLDAKYKIITYNTYNARLKSSKEWSALRFYALLEREADNDL